MRKCKRKPEKYYLHALDMLMHLNGNGNRSAAISWLLPHAWIVAFFKSGPWPRAQPLFGDGVGVLELCCPSKYG